MNIERNRDSLLRLQPPHQPKQILSRSRFRNRGSFLSLRNIFLIVLCILPLSADAREAKQAARIEHLISSVEALKGAKFIRNGTEYDPDKAGAHLRMKLDKAGDKVKTAEDFIDGIASKSSTSGKDYKIRKPDGTLVTSSAFFHARLSEYDKAKSGS